MVQEIGTLNQRQHPARLLTSLVSTTMALAAAAARVVWVAAPPLSVSRSDTDNLESLPLVGRDSG